MTDALVSGLLAGYGVAIPVGAIAVLIIGLSARTSLRIGAAAALGVATADGVYAFAAVAGGAAIAALIRPVATPLKYVAVAVLVVMAVRIVITAWQHHRDPARAAAAPGAARSAGRAYASLLGLTILNPTTVIYFAALVLGNRAGNASGSAVAGTLFVAGVFVASASWQLLLAAGGSALGRHLSSPHGRLATAVVSAALIAFLAVRTLLS